MSLPIYRPMLASPWPHPFSDSDWYFEPKWDGVRAIARCDSGRLASRTGRDITSTYPELRGLAGLGDVVLDGEVVALDPGGNPSFELLQQRINVRGPRRVADLAGAIPVHFLVFDVLYDCAPLIGRPLSERRERLEAIELPAPVVRSPVEPGNGEALFQAICQRGMEGIVAKRAASTYQPGHRSPDWRKIVNVHRTRAVVGGFTPGEGARRHGFGALLLGMWDDDGSLRFTGAVGTGFDAASMRAIRHALNEMTTPECPFRADPALPGDATWVVPHLVAEVEYRQWTSAGRLRAPSFKGFSDREHHSVRWRRDGPSADSGLFDDS